MSKASSYRLIKKIFRLILSTLYRVKVNGLENYYAAGDRVVIVANHTSLIDALLLAAFLPDKLTFAVNTQAAKKWWIKCFLNLVDAFPVDSTNPMSIKTLIEFVQQNKRCIIFPEGRLTMTGSLMKIYEGPGLIADKASALLLPICIQGAQYTHFSRLKGKVRIRWFPEITLTIFPPETISVPAEIKGRQRRQKIGLKLYDLMTHVMFASSSYEKTLFSSLIDTQETHGPKHEIMEDIERKPINYKKFILRCFILGEMIAQQTEPREYVGILLPNMISTAITFFAMHAFLRVPAMLNYSTGAANIVNACKIARIRTVYTSRLFISLAQLTNVANELKKVGVTLIYLEDVAAAVKVTNKLKGFILSLSPRFAYQFINRKIDDLNNPNQPAIVLFTSGSEGKPKGVVLSHSNIQANRCQLSTCIDLTGSDKIFNALPIFHSFGLTGGMLLPLLSGIKAFFYPSPLHYRIVPELVYDTNATILFGTDTFLANYAKYANPYDFYSVRYIFSGAERLHHETQKVWSQKFGVRIFEGYGATEASPVIATNTPMQNKEETVGRFLPGINFQIHAIPGIENGGELVISGPNIMLGYLCATQPGIIIPPDKGWYSTGDIVNVDAGGFVTIKGRAKRFAKIAGEMVSLPMVEEYISELWPEFQHAVIHVPDHKKGEQLILYTTYDKASREEIVGFVKKHHIGEITIPRKIFVLKKMPLLGTGKIDYTALKEQASSDL